MDELRPRAVTVMVVLRSGICTKGRLADTLGDSTVQETEELLTKMKEAGLIQEALCSRTAWCLTYDGVSWLQAHGESITDRALKEVLDVYRRIS